MDDLISRKAAIEYLMTNMGWHDDDGYEVEDADEKRKVITDLVNGIPTVDAAPVVHGRWVDADGNPVAWSKALPSSPEDSCMCSVCDTWLVGSDELPVYGLFCPACGAKMGGDTE
jgi:hypothetical protein